MAQYYVSSTGNDNANGTTTSTPWQSLSKVQTVLNNGTINAGDTISFKKGDTFIGKMLVANIWGYTAKSGTSMSPITLNSYGSGAKPSFLYPSGGSATPEQRTLMNFVGVQYYVFDGLSFTDSNTTNDKVAGANCGFPLYLGNSDAVTSHCTVQNVDISLCGMGVVLWGSNNIVQNCNLTNFKNLKSTTNTGGSSAYDDYGANPLTIIDGSDNQILNNYVSGGWAESLDFGFNGGFCEMFGSCNRNIFKYNTIIDCGGVSEFGANGSTASSSDNEYAYNKIIDCGGLFYCNISGPFACQVSNVQFYNNTVIETNNSRFSLGSTNAGAGVTTPEAISHINLDSYQFLYNGSPTATTVFNLKNNVIQIMTPLKVARSSESRMSHTYNTYKFSGGSSLGPTLGVGEVITSAAIFTDTTGTNATLWNLRPSGGSILINAGTAVSGLTVDIEGNSISGSPDAGAYEKVGTTPVLNAFATAPAIACKGGTTTVTVAASGGTPSYSGTGSFTVSAGTYSYTVTDSASVTASVSITVSEPSAITQTISFNPIAVNGGSTTVVVSGVTGGSGTYTYALDSGSYSSTDNFIGVLAGSHAIHVKDSNACISTTNITVTEPANSAVAITLLGKTDVTRRLNIHNLSPKNGSVTLQGAGGTLPYKFNVNDASFRNTTGKFTSLIAGVYKFGVKDAAGLSAYITVTIADCSSGHCI